jgi:uncharacterized membrane protein YdbT with pleckstrin-like domain
MAEDTVWSAHPSQVINFGSYLFLLLLAIPTLGLTLFIILWKWLVVKNTKYELTTERLKTRTGVLNKKVDELELYRVKDYSMEQPFFLRLFSCSNIILETSDQSHPQLTIQAISDAEAVREKIRAYVEDCRVKKGVRETDFA